MRRQLARQSCISNKPGANWQKPRLLHTPAVIWRVRYYNWQNYLVRATPNRRWRQAVLKCPLMSAASAQLYWKLSHQSMVALTSRLMLVTKSLQHRITWTVLSTVLPCRKRYRHRGAAGKAQKLEARSPTEEIKEGTLPR